MNLTYIKGRAAGTAVGKGAPRFKGTCNSDGLVRITCENYPQHLQEIQLSHSDGNIQIESIRGQPVGAADGPGSPKFVGTINSDRLLRIDCENYPEHWQEIQLPVDVVTKHPAEQSQYYGSSQRDGTATV